ncbi:MAG TPA: transposase [Nitrolancea sp.]|jgi:REP element-mobilizing transposase RayT|nr:transposase [Nitrolancea sp.]
MRNKERPQRKQIRLPSAVYGQTGTRVMLTLVAEGRQRIFEKPELASACIDLLHEQATLDAIAVLAYCLMPDHLHLLARVDGTTDMIRFVQAYKSRSTRLAWQHQHFGRLWQRSFHDHFMREIDDELHSLRYILANPIRSGMVETWQDYPFSGSFVYDLADLR